MIFHTMLTLTLRSIKYLSFIRLELTIVQVRTIRMLVMSFTSAMKIEFKNIVAAVAGVVVVAVVDDVVAAVVDDDVAVTLNSFRP